MKSFLVEIAMSLVKGLASVTFRNPRCAIMLIHILIVICGITQLEMHLYENRSLANCSSFERSIPRALKSIHSLSKKQKRKIKTSFDLLLNKTWERRKAVTSYYDCLFRIVYIILISLLVYSYLSLLTANNKEAPK